MNKQEELELEMLRISLLNAKFDLYQKILDSNVHVLSRSEVYDLIFPDNDLKSH